MTTIVPDSLAAQWANPTALTPQGTLSTPSLRAFEDAMTAATQGLQPAGGAALPGPDPIQVAQAATGTLTDAPNPLVPLPPSAATGSASADTGTGTQGDRAAAALGLESNRAETPGDAILSGLEQLRGVFDRSLGNVSSIAEGNAVMSIGQMVELQAQVTQFSLLVDVSSKLAGKSTQAMDSLMRGQ
ncbi:EscI/YscI/HrpB family type III secretion system inner rod protein [Roseicyclus amphidinii]|jgi:hypothetical protein|uniref:EscI/YscI/HrpB family type III secretion system inner rod protein n=1 Tax=Roseicyclus amphidinii TaxID=3034232 RepID=UPI0024E185FC|nr:EscI/YscI/HrpB family type III secretion system inner rod protein [Roseicyclus sp. Amp-Y-6]